MKLRLFLTTCLIGSAAFAESSKPNIVFIFMDDMGYGDVQVLNPKRGKIPTPHMDKMAKVGMIFTDAHTSSSVCTPSRYGLITGCYSWRTRLQRHVLNGYGKPLIPTSRMTVASLLKKQGYETAMIGDTGPKALIKTIQYASDGVHFSKTHDVVNGPRAGGFYRPEAFTNGKKGELPQWGLEIGTDHKLPYLKRFDCKISPDTESTK